MPASVTTITLSVPRARSDAALTSTVSADVFTGVWPKYSQCRYLSGLNLDANNKLYVKTVDVAGAFSKSLQLRLLLGAIGLLKNQQERC